MDEEIEEIPDKIITLKKIFSDSTKEAIALVVVLSFCFLSIHNNNMDALKDGFSVIIGFWISNKANNK